MVKNQTCNSYSEDLKRESFVWNERRLPYRQLHEHFGIKRHTQNLRNVKM